MPRRPSWISRPSDPPRARPVPKSCLLSTAAKPTGSALEFAALEVRCQVHARFSGRRSRGEGDCYSRGRGKEGDDLWRRKPYVENPRGGEPHPLRAATIGRCASTCSLSPTAEKNTSGSMQ